MSNPIFTKKQHYVPQCYLKNFAIRESENYFAFCFFRDSSTVKKINIEHICAVNDLYELIVFDEYVDRNVIEHRFIGMESKYANLCKVLLHRIYQKDEMKLTKNEVETLKLFVSLLVFRSKVMVDSFAEAMTQHILQQNLEYENIREILHEIDDKTFNEEWKPYLNERIGLSIAHHFLKDVLNPNSPSITVRAFMETLGENCCFLYDKNARFVTSDMPVVNIHGTSARDDIEYDVMGMPLSPCVYVVFFDECEEYNHKIIELDSLQVKKINNYQLIPKNKIIIANSLEGIENLIG